MSFVKDSNLEIPSNQSFFYIIEQGHLFAANTIY